VTAYLETARVLRLESVQDFALKTLNACSTKLDGNQVLFHVIAYGEANGSAPPERVPGTLDDYAFTVHAAIDAWQAVAHEFLPGGRQAGRRNDCPLLRSHCRAFYDTATPRTGRRRSASWAPAKAAAGLAHSRRKPNRRIGPAAA